MRRARAGCTPPKSYPLRPTTVLLDGTEPPPVGECDVNDEDGSDVDGAVPSTEAPATEKDDDALPMDVEAYDDDDDDEQAAVLLLLLLPRFSHPYVNMLWRRLCPCRSAYSTTGRSATKRRIISLVCQIVG